MKPVIGIFPSYEVGADPLVLNKNYVSAVTNCGGVPYILPLFTEEAPCAEALEHIDGLLLTGGVDISPEYYGEKNSGKSLDISPLLDCSENLLIELALEQDIPSELGAAKKHSGGVHKPAFHDIQISKSSPLSEAMGFGSHRVNSYHHQAIKKLAPEFSAAALSPDGIIEAIFHQNRRFVLGVQWHPERDGDEISQNAKIIPAFIKICTDSERRTV